ncbi:MAG: Mur ligase family protein, partial [Myxococcota bacterium]
DGHRFCERAVESGARALVVERYLPALSAVPQLVVESTLAALGDIARFHLRRWRERTGGRVLAITGSAGKTTTKTVCGLLLEQLAQPAVVTLGNLNNLVGAPMMALTLTPTHRYAVLEVGTNQKGEIPRLEAITEPDVAVVTLIDAAHTQGLGGIEEVEKEKLSLFRRAPIRIGNGDDERVSRSGARLYGTGENAALRLVNRRLLPDLRQRLVLAGTGGERTVEVPLLGYPGALAVTGAVLAVEALLEPGVDLGRAAQTAAPPIAAADITNALRDFDAGARLRLVRTEALTIIDDSYNSNPAACLTSLITTKEIASELGAPRWGAVLGAMLELGAESAAQHERVGVFARGTGLEWLVTVGELAEPLAAAAEGAGLHIVRVRDAAAAVEASLRLVQTGDVVLVKGSRSIGTESVVAALQQRGDGVARRRAGEGTP